MDELLRQHATAWADIHGYLRDAITEVAARWSDRRPSPADLGGVTRGASVRETLFSMEEEQQLIAESSLSLGKGSGMSFVLKEGGGTKFRVRKYPVDKFHNRVRPVVFTPVGAVDRPVQLSLFDNEQEAAFAEALARAPYDFFVLWHLDLDRSGLAQVDLAAVLDIDSATRVRVLGAAQLPEPRRKSKPAQDRPEGDFGEFTVQVDEATDSGDFDPDFQFGPEDPDDDSPA